MVVGPERMKVLLYSVEDERLFWQALERQAACHRNGVAAQ
jgi:hypothetical protein